MSRSPDRSQIVFMLISAGIFAFFGFGNWAHQYTASTPSAIVPMVVVLKWALRGGAIAFGISALLTMAGSMSGVLIYALVGLLTAAVFVVVAIWDWNSPLFSGVPPLLLVIFALWNGYGSWAGLQEVLARDDPREAPPA